jgi:hypothetical protein
MSSKQMLLQSAVKHILLIVVLLVLQPSIAAGLGRMSQDRDALGLVLIVSSLLIAGTVAGFLCFRYETGGESHAERAPSWHLIVGHVMTAGLLFVLGTLMIVASSGLNVLHATATGGQSYFGGLAAILYMSLVLYDIYALGSQIETSVTGQ